MKKGKTVYLDTINKGDLEQLRSWRNHEPFKKHFREYREITRSMQKKWFKKIVNNNSNHHMFAIREIESNKLIGTIGLTYINWVYSHADLSIYIGDGFVYIDQRAIDAVNIILDYGFNQLQLHKVWTEIYSFDETKINFFNDLNFKIDGQLRDNYFYDGKHWDSIIFSLLSSEFNSLLGKQ